MQRMRYLNLLGMMALRRDRYYYSSDAIRYTGEALALSLETEQLARNRISGTFTMDLATCGAIISTRPKLICSSRSEMTQQNGDLTSCAS